MRAGAMSLESPRRKDFPSRRAWLWGLGLLLGLAGGALYEVGSWLAKPAFAVVGAPPGDLGAESIVFRSRSGSALRGWWCRGGEKAGVVILLHGVRANRLALVGRARFLTQAGYSVLLFDFQAHGESPGEAITFGALEGLDVEAALAEARRRAPGRPIGVLGISMGGAAALLAPKTLDVQALILEEVYSTLEAAISNRLRRRLGGAGAWCTPLLGGQLRWRTGFPLEWMRPIDRIGQQTAPVFVIAAAEDTSTTPAESRALFERAPEPREFWLVPGADHVDLHRVAGQEYEKRILGFLAKCFGREPAFREKED